MMNLHSLRALAKPLARRTAAYSTNKRTFPSFTKYSARSAFQVQPIAPVYATVPGRDYLKTKRTGTIMLSWAPAGDEGKGYTYNDKVFFSLSPTEVGLVLEVLDAKLSEVTLTHSPNMNATNGNDKSRRSLLDVKRLAGADGHPKTELVVVTSDADSADVEEKVSLNAGEARVLKELLVYSLPRLYGFQNALEAPPTVEGSGGNDSSDNWNANATRGRKPSSSGPAAEWPF